MVKRYLGGVISPSPPSIAVTGASGFFSTSQAMQYQAQNLWPLARYTFPGAYNSLFASTSYYKIYVDAVNGNDSNPGTYNLPFASINAAHTARTSVTSQNVMIIVYPGTYTVSPTTATSNSSVCFYDLATSGTVYLCAPRQVIINWTPNANRDGPLCNFQLAASAVYGAIVRRNNNGRTINYTVAFHNNTSATFKGQMVNCVIEEINANGNWSFAYDNAGTMTGSVSYCSYYVSETGINDYSSNAVFVVSNSVFNWPTGTTNATKTNCLNLTLHDMTSGSATPPYVSPGTTTQGVYYGTYAWPETD